MQTPAEFLKALGDRLARFDRHRVAKAGCATGVACLALALVLAAAGVVDLHPIFPHFIRVIMGFVFFGVLGLFLIFAAFETLAERGAMRELRAYLSGGTTDLATLLEMARARSGRFPGSERVIELLERASGSK
jgi:hypothetical protein